MTREIANNGQLLSLTEISVDTRDYKPMESYDHLRGRLYTPEIANNGKILSLTETYVDTRDREQWKVMITYEDVC